MSFLIILYLILLAVFLFISALVVRHGMKYGYLSPRFRIVLFVFGFLAVLVILLSLYFLILLSSEKEPSVKPPSFSGELNF
ncbi:hypothetical protein JXA05_02375 [Candidatus Peregrinibacteria bacterium]|nr:hypothetical protein [Candidatus Peregrinibacteria bacterium]